MIHYSYCRISTDFFRNLIRQAKKINIMALKDMDQSREFNREYDLRSSGEASIAEASTQRAQRKCSAFSAISVVRKVISRLHKNDHNLLSMFAKHGK